MKQLLLAVGLVLLAGTGAWAAEPVRVELSVDGVTREALVCAPATATTGATPVVFVFHGHGGSARQAARSFALEQHWPEAMVVYPQGLNTPGRLTDPEGKRPGWQAGPGDQQDRDVKFFDALLARLKREHRVDERRIFATGHSNGGGFTYLLWRERPAVLAAVAPSAAAAGYARQLTPKPALIVAGEQDGLVKFAWQERTIEAVRKVNGAAARGEARADGTTLHAATNGAPVVTFIHPGGHELPRRAPELIADFFRSQPVREK